MATEPLRGRYTLPAERLAFLDVEPELEVQQLGAGLVDDLRRLVPHGLRRRRRRRRRLGHARDAGCGQSLQAGRSAVEIATVVYSNDHLDRSGWCSELRAGRRARRPRVVRESVVRGAARTDSCPSTSTFTDADEWSVRAARLIFPG